MKLQIKTKTLSEALASVSKAVSSRSSLPILSQIVFLANKSGLELVATDLEIALSLTVPAIVVEEGEVAVPARVLAELMNTFVEDEIEIVAGEQQMMLRTESSKTEINGMSVADFPEINRQISTGMKLPAGELRGAIERLSSIVSREETRPVLTGLYLESDGKQVTIVATDGYRLGFAELKGGSLEIVGKWVLPVRGLLELARAVDKSEIKEVELGFDESLQQMLVKIGDFRLISRVIEGEFPPFRQIVPASTKMKVLLDRDELVRAVKRALVFAREGVNIVRLRFEQDSCQVVAQGGQSGSSEIKISAKVEGELVETAFNGRYLLDYLGGCGEGVEFAIDGTLKPGVFVDDWKQMKVVIMPVRVEG